MMNSDLENYLNNLIEQRKRRASPEYQAKQAQLSEAQYNTDTNPQFIASLGKSLSQLGTLQGKVPGTGGLQDYADSMQQANAQRRAMQQSQAQERDANSGISLKAMQYLDERRRKAQEDAANRELMSKKFESQLSRDKEAQDYRNSMLGLKKQELEQKGELAKQKASIEKEPKQNQFTAASYGIRAQQANDIMSNLEKEGFNRASLRSSLASSLPGFAMSSQGKQQEQAERNFVNAILRRESGAAITESEFNNAKQQYFPKAGDSAEVLKQKKQNREQAIESLKAEAGPALGKIPLVPLQGSEEEVDIITPEGEEATVPRYNLEKVLSIPGFRRAE